MDSTLANAITMISMQIGSRFVQFNLTTAQKKLIQHPITQSLLLLFLFYAASRKLLLSIIMIIGYYLLIHILLNEQHPFNIYSRKWLMDEGFIDEDDLHHLKENYYTNVKKLV
jgi:hypothetical protein